VSGRSVNPVYVGLTASIALAANAPAADSSPCPASPGPWQRALRRRLEAREGPCAHVMNRSMGTPGLRVSPHVKRSPPSGRRPRGVTSERTTTSRLPASAGGSATESTRRASV
jgi:hypothetical protein